MSAALVDPDRRRDAIESVAALPGWLLEGDATTLYDLAHRANGPILEVGTYRGKSTVLMATALRDAGRDGPVVSLDVDAAGLREAAAHLGRHDLGDRVVLVRGTATPCCAPARLSPRPSSSSTATTRGAGWLAT